MSRTIILNDQGGRTSVPMPEALDRAILNRFGERWQKDGRTRCPTCKKGRLEESKPSDWPAAELKTKDRAARRRVLKAARKDPLGKRNEGIVYRCTNDKCGGRVRVHPIKEVEEKE